MNDHDQENRPPVERLSEISWARIERGVFARLDDGTVTNANAVSSRAPVEARRTWLWLAVPALAAASVAIVLLTRPSQQPAQVARAAAEYEPARVVAGLTPTEVSFDDVHVALDADSALVMPRDAGSSTLLEQGAAWFTVAPRGARPPFVVLAGDTTVRVIGTRFRVARDGDHTDVTVDHGIVEVGYRGNVVRISADQTWSSDKPAEVASTKTAAAEPEIELEPDPIKPTHVKRKKHVRPVAAGPAPTATPAPASDPDEDRYTELAQIEPKQPEVAMKGYLALSQGSSRWASAALYAAARLAMDRKDPRAETLLTVYLRRFPNGANAADVTLLLNRLKGETP